MWGRMDTCISMAESLSCSPETITTLLISSTSIQNKKLFFLFKKKKEALVLCRPSYGVDSPQHTHTLARTQTHTCTHAHACTHAHIYGTNLAATLRGPGGRYRKQDGTRELRGWEKGCQGKSISELGPPLSSEKQVVACLRLLFSGLASVTAVELAVTERHRWSDGF